MNILYIRGKLFLLLMPSVPTLPLMPWRALPFWGGKKEAKTALFAHLACRIDECRGGGNFVPALNHLAKIASKLADAQTIEAIFRQTGLSSIFSDCVTGSYLRTLSV